MYQSAPAVILNIVLLLGLLAPISHASELPELGGTGVVAPGLKRTLDADAARYIYWQYDVVSDPQLAEYIEILGTKLAANSGHSQRRFSFYFINDKIFNAFATWGGNVAVNTGAMLYLEEEGELAALLAHELGHLVQDAPARQMEFSKGPSWSQLAIVTGALLLVTGETELGFAALFGGIAGGYQSFFNFSRGQEREADRIGIRILSDTGYDSAQMAALFKRMESASRFQQSLYSEYLSTHPLTENRIADSRNHASQFDSQMSASSLQFELMRIRVQQLHANSNQGQLDFYRQRLTEGTHPKEQANRYGYALSLMTMGRYQEALENTEILLSHAGSRVPYLILKSDILLETNNIEAAKQALELALQRAPSSYALSVRLANIYSILGQNDLATLQYKNLVASRPYDPFVRQSYARALGNSNQSGLAHEQQAELYFILGAFKEAITQLKLAKSAFQDNSRKLGSLDKRILEIEAEIERR